MNKKAMIMGVMCLTAFLSILYVRSRFLVIEMSLKIQEAQKTKFDFERQKSMLMLELETLKNPKRIETIASEQLGLRQYASPLIVSLDEGGKVNQKNIANKEQNKLETVNFISGLKNKK